MLDLRTVLRLDAAASGGLGILLLLLTGPADEHLGLPVGLSVGLGAVLLAWAGLVTWVSTHLRRAWVGEIVVLNLVYVVGSVVLALSGWVSLTGLGVAFVLAQAVAVLGLTAAQAAGLRAPSLPTGARAS